MVMCQWGVRGLIDVLGVIEIAFEEDLVHLLRYTT